MEGCSALVWEDVPRVDGNEDLLAPRERFLIDRPEVHAARVGVEQNAGLIGKGDEVTVLAVLLERFDQRAGFAKNVDGVRIVRADEISCTIEHEAVQIDLRLLELRARKIESDCFQIGSVRGKADEEPDIRRILSVRF